MNNSGVNAGGRSRGRSRGSLPQAETGRGKRTNPVELAIGAGNAPSAWGPPSTARPPAPCNIGMPTQRQPIAPVLGRAATHREEAPSCSNAPKAQGLDQPQDVRGTVRGKRVIGELIRTRPQDCLTKAGTSGHKISVQTNYFRVLKKPEWSIHQYRVDLSPEVDSIRLRRAYLAEHKRLLGGYIFDGTVLFCATFLGPQMVNGSMELKTKNREGETILITIKHVGIVEVTDVQQMQVLNLILRRAMEGLNLQLVGRNFFDPKAKIAIDAFKLEIWPGYQTSIRQHEQDVLLCSEIAHKVMRNDSIYHILNQNVKSAANYQDSFKREIVGSIVLTDYNNKTYRVDDVDFQLTPKKSFTKSDGTELTLAQYYKERYNINIKDLSQPLLVSRPTEKNQRGGQDQCILLIPELCRATGLTDDMRNNFRMMKALGEYTRLSPERRIERLLKFNSRLQNAKESMNLLNEWNFKLDHHLVEVPARVLPPERILFGNNKSYTCDENADWNRQFRQTPMFTQIAVNRWYVLVPRRNVREVKEFVKMCINAARGMGMNITEPKYVEMQADRNTDYSQAIDVAASSDPQIVMAVLVNNNEDKYCCIKKKCCIDRPMPSQVVTLRTIAPRGEKTGGLMSIATKVVIQINAKLMGLPWMIKIPIQGLMTIGFDVCHSAKDRNKSYGALVATMDMNLSSRYYSHVKQHDKGQELSNDIAAQVTCAIRVYRNTHGGLPERILFYRDGVGEGQLHQVYNHEVDALKSKLDEIYKSAGQEKGYRLAFILVSKRINTRYFTNKRNPVPGTVVDDIITLPERYDFYLVSQSVRQGTVSPTSYNVLFDTMGLSADRLQILTYKMTHMYYNWSGTCRVPAVCQYAHKLAFLVAESIHRPPSNLLENQLYFL